MYQVYFAICPCPLRKSTVPNVRILFFFFIKQIFNQLKICKYVLPFTFSILGKAIVKNVKLLCFRINKERNDFTNSSLMHFEDLSETVLNISICYMQFLCIIRKI